MNIDDFEFDDKAEQKAKEKRESKLKEDEKPVEQSKDDCEGCKI